MLRENQEKDTDIRDRLHANGLTFLGPLSLICLLRHAREEKKLIQHFLTCNNSETTQKEWLQVARQNRHDPLETAANLFIKCRTVHLNPLMIRKKALIVSQHCGRLSK